MKGNVGNGRHLGSLVIAKHVDVCIPVACREMIEDFSPKEILP